MGYDFSQAVADIVDNSIEADATKVAIDVEFDGDDSWVRISDNGKGMTPERLREAMRYGADREYDKDDLGKFGLGMKTASMSQCQCLSVASRWNPDRTDIVAYSWDLDHIEKTDRWEILPIERNNLGPSIREPLKDSTGTVVLWRRLDRILGYKHPYGEQARKSLIQTCREIELHLGMVFHLFLNGEIAGKQFKILLNGNEVKPWDPFCRSESKTKRLHKVTIQVNHEGISGNVVIEPFVVPPKEDFSSIQAHEHAGGPASWNQQQGFYIYRAGRMIQSGGWCKLRAPDEHTKLARIAVCFSPELDSAFKINVAKMRVYMPAIIRDSIQEATAPVLKLAREIYDRKPVRWEQPASVQPAQPLVKSDIQPFENSAPQVQFENNSGQGTHNAPPQMPAETPGKTLSFTLAEWSQRLFKVATEQERPVIESVLQRIQP